MPRIFSAFAFALLFTLALGCSLLSAQDGATDAATNDADAEAGFVAIFDGKTLDGWKKVGGNAEYHIEDGVIVGVCENSNPNTFLRTEATYSDFEFRCEFKWAQTSNSGIQYRSHQRPDKDGNATGRVYGYQFELDPSDRAWSGGLFEEGRRKWLQNVAGEENAAKRTAIKLDDWNQIVIRCEGNHLQTWLNGVAITDYTDEADEALAEGFIALQVHSGKAGTMMWKNLRIKDLSKE